jgi:hypothetical protein
MMIIFCLIAAQQDTTQQIHSPQSNPNNTVLSTNNTMNSSTQPDNDGRYHGTELVMLYDYKVRHGFMFIVRLSE